MASTIEVDNTFFPASDIARLIAFLDNEVKAELKSPLVACAITPDLPLAVAELRYWAMLRPAAIPVTLGCGIAGRLRLYVLLRAIVFLGFERLGDDLVELRRDTDAW